MKLPFVLTEYTDFENIPRHKKTPRVAGRINHLPTTRGALAYTSTLAI